MDRVLTRFALTLAIVLCAALFLLAGIGFLCGALDLYLAARLGPVAGAGLTGLAAILIALIILLAARLMGGSPAAQAKPALPLASADTKPGALLSALLGAEMGKGLREHPKSAALVALLAGVAVGGSPRLRALLIALLDGLAVR